MATSVQCFVITFVIYCGVFLLSSAFQHNAEEQDRLGITKNSNTNEFEYEPNLEPVSSDSSLSDANHNQTQNNSVDTSKIAIDWSKVENTFNQYLSEDEILQKWELMEANVKSGIRSLLRTVFPKVVSMSSDAQVSSNCSAGILKWIVSLRHMKSWAMKMLDATGKPPSGIFEGVVTMFGNYDECLKIRAFHDDEDDNENFYNQDETGQEAREFFRGQYCVAEFKPWLPKKPRFYGMNTYLKLARDDDTVFSEFAKMSVFFHFIAFRMDLCVPSTCTKEDMQRVATLMANLAEFRAHVLRCEVDTNDSKWMFNMWISWAVSILAVSVFLVTTIATLKDCHIIQLRCLNVKLLQTFSIINSWKVLNEVKNFKTSKLNSLYAARVLILLWIIIVHTFIVVDFQYFREMQTLKMWATKWPTQILTNSLFQFDCLILITAFTFGYYNIDNSAMQLFKYLLTRYFRLAILMLSMIAITLLTPLFIVRGPITQDFILKQTQGCQNNGWINLLFLHNYFNSDCLTNTWIFCVEFQLMLLMCPLIIFRHKSATCKWLFWAALPVMLVIGFVYSFFTVYIHKLPPTYYWTLPDKEQRNEYFSVYYYKPWAHLTVFAIGFYAGVYRKISNSDKNKSLNDQNVSYFGYILSVFIIVIFTFGFHDWIINELPNEFISALYNSCQNIGLSLAYSWILFSLTERSLTNSNSLLNQALNSRIVCFLGRLTLSGYLVLPLVQTLLLSTQQQPLYSSTILMLYVLMGNIILTYIFALCLSLLVEIPTSLVCFPVLNYFVNSNSSRKSDNDASNESNDKTKQNPNTSPSQTDIELPMCKEKL